MPRRSTFDSPHRTSHRARPSRLGWWLTGCGLAIVLVAAAAIAWIGPASAQHGTAAATPSPSSSRTGDAEPATSPEATATPTQPPTHLSVAAPPLELRAGTVNVPVGDFLGWALMDRRTGEIWGSNLTTTTWTASMIKVWLAADFLRRAAADGEPPSTDDLAALETMIRDSDNDAAETTYQRLGGTATITRLISTCHLTDTSATPYYWSYTSMSARDAVRMADCVADGTAAGPQWTSWLLAMMRAVRGSGDFGIRDAFPADEAATIAIKNGWLDYDDDHMWRVNCLAVSSTWALSVLQRFPDSGADDIGFDTAQQVCTDVASQLRM